MNGKEFTDVDVVDGETFEMKKVRVDIPDKLTEAVKKALKDLEGDNEDCLIAPMLPTADPPLIGFAIMIRENKKTRIKYRVKIEEV